MTSHEGPLGIDVSSVAYSYPDSTGADVLSGIEIHVMPGEMIALIGPSGAGKSTLVSLILGLLQPSEGEVLINGESPRKFIEHNPGKVSLVPQETSLIVGTVAENIALGYQPHEIDYEQVRKSLEVAELSEWVSNLVHGVQTTLELGSVSGGQLQRLGIARALYSNPSLIVLDEPTSALDADTENRVATSLQKLRGAVTQVVVAHRLTTIQSSDKVYLLENGTISASGTFLELCSKSETVARQVEHLTFKSV